MKKLLLILLFGFAVPSYATTWYVSATGSNSNNCTAAQTITTPKLTITAALACVGAAGTEDGAGDIVQVAAGTYSESLIDVIPSGTSGSPFTLRCITALACTVNRTSGQGYHVGFTVGAHWIVIEKFKFVGQEAGTNSAGGMYFSTTIKAQNVFHDITFQDNEIGPSIMGFQSSGARAISVLRNDIHDCGSPTFAVGLLHCVYPSNYSDSWIIDGNDIGPSYGYGVTFYASEGPAQTGFIIKNNTVHNAGVSGSNGAGIHVVHDAQVLNNVVYSNIYQGILIRAGDSALVYGNTAYGNGVGSPPDSGGISMESGTAICKDNISYGNGGVDIVCSTEGNNLVTDPSFQNAAIGEFHLTTGSAALPPCGVALAEIPLDKDGVTRPNPPSCGAYEIPSGSNPTDPLAENFDAYTATSSIDTLNGGSGWTQSWQLISGTMTVETAPAWMSGKSLRQNSTTESEARRFLTAHSGVFSIFFSTSLSTTPNDYIIVSALATTGSVVCRVAFDPAGDLYVETALLDSVITTNHAYAVEMNFDTAGQANKCRAKIDGGSYSPWVDTATALTSIGGLKVTSYATNAHTFLLDNISDEAGVGGAGTITNVTPASGQVCTSGSTCAISWGSNGITGAVNLYYLVGGNQYLIASPDVTATPYSWTVNAPAGTTIKTRVSQGGVSGDSSSFTVLGTKAYFK